MSTKNTLLYVNAILTFTEIKTLNEIKCRDNCFQAEVKQWYKDSLEDQRANCYVSVMILLKFTAYVLMCNGWKVKYISYFSKPWIAASEDI